MAGNPYLWSTTAATNSASDADINWAEGQLPGTVNDSARAMMAGVAGWLKDTNGTLTTGGSANAQTVTSNVAYVALATGMRLVLKAGFTNTGAATLNLTPSGGAAFGAKAIKVIGISGEGDPSGGSVRANGHYLFEYDTAANAAAGAWILLNPSLPILSCPAPQGRLTLQTVVPVMISTQSAKTTIYYTPFQGNIIPIYDGSVMVPTAFAELSVATTDTAKSPAAIGASKVNDWFVWNDAGTVRVGHGPDWTSDTARSAGTALVMVNGVLLNNASLTNGPAASRGTYVGTTRSNASSQLDWIYGTRATGGGAGFFGIWNAYNRRPAASFTADDTDSWTYDGSGVIRATNGSATWRCSFVTGLAEDSFSATLNGNRPVPSAGGPALVSIGIDSTTAAVVGATSAVGVGANYWMNVALKGQPVLGFHFVTGQEQSIGGTSTFFGDGGSPNSLESALFFEGWF